MNGLFAAPSSRTLRTYLGGLALCVLAASPVEAQRYDGNLIPAVRTDQDDINAGVFSEFEIFYRGAHLYTNRFTTNDGFGEGETGPRVSEYRLGGNPFTPFVRINGLDAQACFDCHQAMGYRPFGDSGMQLPREPGVVGGGMPLSNNVLIFEDHEDMNTGIVRNPPHTFGHGYAQRLTDEMTADLLDIAAAATQQAADDNMPVRVELITKGIPFGFLTVNPDGSWNTDELEGVSEDLVLRPFQFKAITSSIRSFVRSALNFHFSMQPEELLDRGLIADDQDEILNEISEGEVSAISIFLAMIRPPVQDVTGLNATLVAEGEQLFDTVGCTTCHVPSLRINDPRITITDPRVVFKARFNETGTEKDFVSLKDGSAYKHMMPKLVAPEESPDYLFPVFEYRWARETEKLAQLAGVTSPADRPPGYTFSLNSDDLPPESYPRLAYNEDGSIDVPVFSDFKRHDMGEHLSDTIDEPTDVFGITVPKREFMTRPLWGVADTQPYLHDGRATTLLEAILMHEGPGSEANAVIGSFKSLDPMEQEAIVEFLRSLRVAPMARGMGDSATNRWLIR